MMSSSNVFCSSCGARNESDALYCSSCGARLAAPAPPPPVRATPPPLPSAVFIPPAVPPRKSNPLPWLVAVGAIIILLVLVLAEAVIIMLPQGTATQAGATLSVSQGQALLQRGGRGAWIEVVENIAVEAGDRIKTSDASHAVLSFMEGTTTELRELTELTIDELQVVRGQRVVIRIDLDAGEVWNRVAELPADSMHEVTTMAAKVICRGSEYGVAVNEMGTTWVRGQEGRVEVTAGGTTVPLAPGDTLMVEVGSSPVSYGAVAMVPTAPVQEPTSEVTASIEGPDMPTFLNQPLPTGTPTNTPPPTSTPRPTQAPPLPTATSRPQPTATVRSVDCPTITIREPSVAPAQGPFGIEFDRQPGKPAGYEWAVEFRQPNGPWNRAEPVPANVDKRGQFWMAELRAPGEGEWHWRICLVASDDLRGPSYCCSERKVITHQVQDHGGDPCDTT